MLLGSFDQDALAGQRGNGKVLESTTLEMALEIHKYIMAKMIDVCTECQQTNRSTYQHRNRQVTDYGCGMMKSESSGGE